MNFRGIDADTHNVDANNLAIRLLDLLQLAQEVPETGLGDDFVGREDAHAVELRRGVRRCWEVAADDLVFLEAHLSDRCC